MASNFESSIHGGSDLFYEFSCFTCRENDSNTGAEFYCEKCTKLFCGKCVQLHNTLFNKHATLGKENISQWPETNVDALEQCQDHKKDKLTGFCEDHNQLICHVCHIYNHQKCSHVVLIADKVKDHHHKGDFKQVSATLDTLHGQLIQKNDDFEKSMQSFEKSCNKSLEEIKTLRKKINDSLDQLEKNTVKELNTIVANMKVSFQTDIKKCIKSAKNIVRVQKDWQRRKYSDAVNLVMYRKCLDQTFNTKAVLQEMTTKNENTFTFHADTTIQQALSTLTGLGQILCQVKQSQAAESTTQETVTRKEKTKTSNLFAIQHWRTPEVTKPSVICDPNQVIRVKSSKRYSIRVKNDSDKCLISGICETAAGEFIITDFFNKRVKLLDQTYKVVAHCDLPGTPRHMCSIDSRQVAVAMNTCMVHFIKVTNSQLVMDSIVPLQHECMGIAYHQGNLYIASGSALYRYNMDEKLVSKMDMYGDSSSYIQVMACAVSPDGDRIYMINFDSKQLVTIYRNGIVISTLTDPALKGGFIYVPPCLHVTDSGQVLLCGYLSNTILQIDKDGRQRLAEVVTQKDGVVCPTSVYYSKNTGSLIVGMSNTNDIIVFKEQ